MKLRAPARVARLLIGVLLLSFLAPSFAWHQHAEHHEIAVVEYVEHGHDDAHLSIGHLIGHLPMQASAAAVAIPEATPCAPAAHAATLSAGPEYRPPHRPPLPLRFA